MDWVRQFRSSLLFRLIRFNRMLDMLEDFLAFRSIPYARLDGSTNRPRRTLDIKLVSMSLDQYMVCPLI